MTEATSPRFLFLSLSNVLSVSGLLNFVWLEERKNRRMENYGRMENWENRKVLVFPHMCLIGGVEKGEGGKLFCLVREKGGKMENVVYINWLLCLCYIKIPKGLISVKKLVYFSNLLPTSSFLLSFPPKLGGQNFVGLEGKFSTPFSFPLVFSLEPNKGKFHFLSYFPLLLFPPPYFHSN